MHWTGIVAGWTLVILLPVASWAAPPSLVAPRAIVVDGDGTMLYGKSPESVALQGSIAKLMTAYVVYWAVDQGHVKWNDLVSLTARDVKQACSCMKSTATVSFKPPGCQPTSQSATQQGEIFRLEDLLRVTINQSTGESSDALAEYVARKVYKLPDPKSTDDSDLHMNYFVGLMNLRAKELGLKNSLWVTVHGGDGCDFAKGCDPTCTPQSCTRTKCALNQRCGGGTTVRDLTILWRALVRRPSFLPLIGPRAFNLNQANPAKTYYNSYGHAFNYYPGVDGDKNGGSLACPNNALGPSASCHIAQATRAGRTLVGAALQSFTTVPIGPGVTGAFGVGAQDVTALFRWAFASLLAPVRVTDTTLAMQVKDHALACRAGMCAGAVRTQSDALTVVLWGPAPSAMPQASPLPLTQLDLSAPPSGFGPLTGLDVAFNDLNIVAGVVVNGHVRLGAWWMESAPLPTKVKLSFRGDSGTQAGDGTLVRTVWLSDDLLLTAVREAGGAIRLATWKTDLAAKQNPFQLLKTATVATPNLGATGELVVAANQQPGLFFFPPPPAFQVVIGTATPAGAAALQAWMVDGTTGALTAAGTTSLGNGSNLSLASNGRGKFAVSMTAGGPLAAASVQTWDVTAAGVFTNTMKRSETTVSSTTRLAPMGPGTLSFAIPLQTLNLPTNTVTAVPPCTVPPPVAPAIPPSQFSSAAFLMATFGTSGAQLSAWDSPAFYNEVPATAPLTDFRLADSGTAWGPATDIQLARFTTMDDSDGEQFVTTHRRADGQLAVILWKIGTLPK